MSAKAICSCNHCNQNIEFEAEYDGTTIPCPTCGVDTVLLSPALKKQRHDEQRLKQEQDKRQQEEAAYKHKRESEWAREHARDAAKNALLTCHVCKGNRSASAAACPHCGHPFNDSADWGSVFTVVFKVLVALLVWSVPFGMILATLRFIFAN